MHCISAQPPLRASVQPHSLYFNFLFSISNLLDRVGVVSDILVDTLVNFSTYKMLANSISALVPSESPESNPDSSSRTKYHPSQGDAVLVSFLAGGNSKIARHAGQQPLASEQEVAKKPTKGGAAIIALEDDEKEQGDMVIATTTTTEDEDTIDGHMSDEECIIAL